RIYQQPDPNLPGYNPNEEHAFIDSNGRLHALRNDLNRANTSSNFVIVEFPHVLSGVFVASVYQVVLPASGADLRNSGEVGKELSLPAPVSLLDRSGCVASPTGPVFTDYQGKIYGRYGPTTQDPLAEGTLLVSYRAQQLNFFVQAGAGRTHDAS